MYKAKPLHVVMLEDLCEKDKHFFFQLRIEKIYYKNTFLLWIFPILVQIYITQLIVKKFILNFIVNKTANTSSGCGIICATYFEKVSKFDPHPDKGLRMKKLRPWVDKNQRS